MPTICANRLPDISAHKIKPPLKEHKIMSNFILPQNPTARNGQPQRRNNLISVELVKDCRTLATGKVLLAGTRGRIVNTLTLPASNGGIVTLWQVDFGFMTVVNIPANSQLVRLGVR